MCAEDIALLALSAESLQTLLDNSLQFSEDREIQFNATKLVWMKFRPHKYRGITTCSFNTGGVPLVSVGYVNYLWHLMCASMKDDSDLNREWRRLNIVGNILIRKFSNSNIHVKRELFRTYCSNSYCRALLSTYKVESACKLKVCHNDILRRRLGVPRWSSATRSFIQESLDSFDVGLQN